MRTPGQRGVVTALAIVLGLGIATAQRLPHPAALNAQGKVEGSLTVTIIVASSVGVVIGPDRQVHLIAANIVDPADNVSRIEYVQLSSAQKDESMRSAEKETTNRKHH
jgi:H+/gluconate symporter-like permease